MAVYLKGGITSDVQLYLSCGASDIEKGLRCWDVAGTRLQFKIRMQAVQSERPPGVSLRTPARRVLAGTAAP